jgi:hypothetical protein
MPSLRCALLAAATFGLAFAQAKDYPIDLDNIDETTRNRWCDDQMTTCPYICDQVADRTTQKNECWPENLTYSCICGDGKPANDTEYSLTLPYYKCTQYGIECVAACPAEDNQCKSDCRENNPCGATSPQRVNATSTSATVEPTSSETESADGVKEYKGPGGIKPSDEDKDGGSDSGAMSLNSVQAVSMAVVFGSLFAGFAML